MRFAYLILAHRDLAQLRALIERLLRDDPDDLVVLHLDARCPVPPDEIAALRDAFGRALLMTPRIASRWGHHSLCAAELLLMQALASRRYDYAHLLSGQDWPIRRKSEIVAGIQSGTCYLTLDQPAMSERMDDFHLHGRLMTPGAPLSPPAYYARQGLRAAAQLLNGALAAAGRKRRCPFGPDWKRGSQWWSLPHAAVAHVAAELASTIASGRLRFTVCSDEQVIQTILAHSPFAPAIEDNRRFFIWNGASSPETLTAAHLPAIRVSDDWFARKCEAARDSFFLSL